MTDCPDCKQAATTWHWGGVRADCAGCAIRSVAICPPHIRRAEYALVAADEREAFVDQVNAERRRIRELRGGPT